MNRLSRQYKAFTLVEILIVVLILGILAAIVVPKFSTASATARTSMMADDLRIMRMQLEVFRGQHLGVSAGYPGCDAGQLPTSDTFVAHITQSSDAAGNTAPAGTLGYRYGPYMSRIPVNPVNDKDTVLVIGEGDAFPTEGQNLYGWIYQPSTLTFKPDLPGVDDTNRPYMDY